MNLKIFWRFYFFNPDTFFHDTNNIYMTSTSEFFPSFPDNIPAWIAIPKHLFNYLNRLPCVHSKLLISKHSLNHNTGIEKWSRYFLIDEFILIFLLFNVICFYRDWPCKSKGLLEDIILWVVWAVCSAN